MTLRVAHWIGDLATALALTAVAVAMAVLSYRLGLGSAAEPGAGLFPLTVSLIMAASGAGCALRALRSRDHDPEARTAVVIDGGAIRAGLLIAALCLAFVDGGFVVAGFVFMWTMLSWVGRRSAARSALVSAAVIAVFWLVFDRLLGVQLPDGLIAEWLQQRSE